MSTKMWFILLEDINYNAENISNIFSSASVRPFESEDNNINQIMFDKWQDNNFQIKKYMVFKMYMLDNLEKFFIKNGILFNWIIYKNNYIGLRVQPTKVDLSALVKDSMTFELFSWNREYMNIKAKSDLVKIKKETNDRTKNS